MPAPGAIVVYFEVSPEAVEKKSFDKLLSANGIAWRRQPMQKTCANRVRSRGRRSATVSGNTLQKRRQEPQSAAGQHVDGLDSTLEKACTRREEELRNKSNQRPADKFTVLAARCRARKDSCQRPADLCGRRSRPETRSLSTSKPRRPKSRRPWPAWKPSPTVLLGLGPAGARRIDSAGSSLLCASTFERHAGVCQPATRTDSQKPGLGWGTSVCFGVGETRPAGGSQAAAPVAKKPVTGPAQ